MATKFVQVVLEKNPSYFDIVAGVKKLTFEEKLEEVCEYLKKYKTLPTEDQKGIRFSDGSAEIGQWLIRNKKKIYELYLSGDELATKFVQVVLEKNPSYFDIVAVVKKLTFEEQLEEAYEYLQDNGELPTSNQKGIRFSDGLAEIGQWLIRNKKKIYELYLSNDELATKFVQAVLVKYPDYFDAVKKKLAGVEKMTFEEKLEEVYEYLKSKGTLPTGKQEDIKFSDDTVMGTWLDRSRQKIYRLYLLGDELATKFVLAVLEIKPKYFDKIKEVLDAEAEFKAESKFEEVKETVSKSPKTTDLKGEKENGREIH